MQQALSLQRFYWCRRLINIKIFYRQKRKKQVKQSRSAVRETKLNKEQRETTKFYFSALAQRSRLYLKKISVFAIVFVDVDNLTRKQRLICSACVCAHRLERTRTRMRRFTTIVFHLVHSIQRFLSLANRFSVSLFA